MQQRGINVYPDTIVLEDTVYWKNIGRKGDASYFPVLISDELSALCKETRFIYWHKTLDVWGIATITYLGTYTDEFPYMRSLKMYPELHQECLKLFAPMILLMR